jgi:two-component system LytT family sensor kinase
MASGKISWLNNSQIIADFTKINLLFWGFIAIMNYFQDVLLLSIQETDSAWSFAAIFSFDWPLWAAFTPFIIQLAIRYPLTWKGMYKSFSIQLGWAALVVIIHTIFEFLIIEFLIHSIFPQYGDEVYLPGYFMASIHSKFIVYFLIVGVVHRFELYSKYQAAEVEKSRLKEQLSAAQLEALRMQLQPHFLFNTHHAISGLILKNENNRAIQMLSRLGDLLRKSLEKSKTDFIPLFQELEMVSAYMAIQQVRFQDKLKFTLQVDPALNEIPVPSFFLQPLIENAVIHGIEPSAREGFIELIINRSSEEFLIITLHDNGVGLHNLNPDGIGLSNTKLRLNQLYKKNYSFIIQPGGSNNGTSIIIKVPLNPGA